MTQTYITAEWMNKLWYILVIETIQQWNKWTIASLKNMAKFPRQNKELKTSNTSICCVCVCVCVCVCTQLCPTLCEPPGLYPTRFLCPWNFPGKNTRVGCHFLLQGIFPDPWTEPMSLVSSVLESQFFTTLPHGKPHVWMRTQSCPTLCDPMDYSPPDSSVQGTFQARMHLWYTFIYVWFKKRQKCFIISTSG